MTNVREEKIASAIDAINGGMPQREAATKWDIPQSTLSGRIHGATSKTEVLLGARRLSPLQERFLVDWCLNEEVAARVPRRLGSLEWRNQSSTKEAC